MEGPIARQFHFGQSVAVTTAPDTEPVTAAEAKNWLKVDHSADDDLISSLITAARQAVEEYTGIKLYTQVITEKWDRLPSSNKVYNQFGAISLSTWPVQSIDSISYVDDAGDSQTWSSSNYTTDLAARPARISPAFDAHWPTVRFQMSAFTVVYTAGYSSTANIPDTIKTAMRLMITHWYDNRTDSVRKMPMASEVILQPYKTMVYV